MIFFRSNHWIRQYTLYKQTLVPEEISSQRRIIKTHSMFYSANSHNFIFLRCHIHSMAIGINVIGFVDGYHFGWLTLKLLQDALLKKSFFGGFIEGRYFGCDPPWKKVWGIPYSKWNNPGGQGFLWSASGCWNSETPQQRVSTRVYHYRFHQYNKMLEN